MNFAEWSEKRKKEPADAVSFDDGSFGGGGSFGGASGTRERVYGGRGGVSAGNAYTEDGFSGISGDFRPEKEKEYSIVKGIAGGVQKGLTGIAKKGGATAALAEDILFAPMEKITGQQQGNISDYGPLNLWNDSIQRAAEAVDDYYADNIAAGGLGAEFFDKLLSKAVSLFPDAAVGYFTGGVGNVPELEIATLPGQSGTMGAVKSITDKLTGDPQYWFSVAGTTGESYQDTMDDTEDDSSWWEKITRSAGKGLYKEAVNTSEEIPDYLTSLAEIAHEMYEEKYAKTEAEEEKNVLQQALDGLMELLWK